MDLHYPIGFDGDVGRVRERPVEALPRVAFHAILDLV
jgi:hypothetical protein